MEIQTKEFGVVEVEEGDIIHFDHPIYGFEALTDYIVLVDDEIGAQIIWLQSIQNPNTCFICFNMSMTDETYRPYIGDNMMASLQVQDEANILYCTIAGIKEDDYANSVINLKSPIVINTENNLGAQIILDEDYPLRFKVFGEKKC